MTDSIIIGFEEGIKYLPFLLSVSILFRISHFPDLGVQGIYILGVASLHFFLHLGIPEIICLLFTLIIGGVGGVLTATFFIKFKLNSIICGILTSLITFSLSYLLTNNGVPDPISVFFDEYDVGLIGLLIAFILSVFFSTRNGLLYRFAGESPKLLYNLGYDPRKELFILIVLGNALVSLSGALTLAVNGSPSLNLADNNLIMAISGIILGEGFIYLLLKVSLFFLSRSFLMKSLHYLKVHLYGSGAFLLLFGACLGSIIYWVLVNIISKIFGYQEYSSTFIGLVSLFILISTKILSKKDLILSNWKFH